MKPGCYIVILSNCQFQFRIVSLILSSCCGAVVIRKPLLKEHSNPELKSNTTEPSNLVSTPSTAKSSLPSRPPSDRAESPLNNNIETRPVITTPEYYRTLYSKYYLDRNCDLSIDIDKIAGNTAETAKSFNSDNTVFQHAQLFPEFTMAQLEAASQLVDYTPFHITKFSNVNRHKGVAPANLSIHH